MFWVDNMFDPIELFEIELSKTHYKIEHVAKLLDRSISALATRCRKSHVRGAIKHKNIWYIPIKTVEKLQNGK